MDNPLVNALIGSSAVVFFGSCIWATCYRLTTGHLWRRPQERIFITVELASPVPVVTSPQAVVVDLDLPPPNNQTK